jgi:HK97 family phage major capsid protein
MLDGEDTDDPTQLARHITAAGTPTYRRAWASQLAGHGDTLEGEERWALNRYHGIAVRTATEGGSFGDAVPFDLDSAIIGLSGGMAAPVHDICRTVTLTQGDTWHGVSSQLATGYAWAAEDSTATDASLTIAQPTLPVYRAQAVVPVSVELLADYGGEGFQAEMAKILATEYLTFMVNATLNANGSGQPYGIFTQLYNTTTSPAPPVTTTRRIGRAFADMAPDPSAISGMDIKPDDHAPSADAVRPEELGEELDDLRLPCRRPDDDAADVVGTQVAQVGGASGGGERGRRRTSGVAQGAQFLPQ